jgi:pimeloyl-ACP methyl ester carboxylesterase
MLRAEVGGLSVAYERAGDGPTLVLLHGFTHDSRAWRPQLQSLADQFTVIAWDAPGAGHSTDPPESFGISDWADCLAGFFDAVGVHSAHIVGLSWGGLLAQEFYRHHAARVRSLVLADTYAGWKGSLPEPIPVERLAACLRDASLPPSEFVPRYLPGMFGASPRQEVCDELARVMSDFHPVGFRLMATALAHADTRDLLPNIRVPALLVWGDADARSPMTVAHQLRDAIPVHGSRSSPGLGTSATSRNRPGSTLWCGTSACRSRSGDAFARQTGLRPRRLAMPRWLLSLPRNALHSPQYRCPGDRGSTT